MAETNHDSPVPTGPALPSASLVNVCDAADCAYNRDRACRAGAISIAFIGGRPLCATYSPRPAPEMPETEKRPGAP